MEPDYVKRPSILPNDPNLIPFGERWGDPYSGVLDLQQKYKVFNTTVMSCL